MPQIRIRDAGGTLRTIQRIRMRDGEGQLRTIQRIRARDAAGILRTIWQNMTASASPGTLSATGTVGTIITGSATATPSGGTAPYTYLWQAADYNFDDINASTPTAATTTFRKSRCEAGNVYIGDMFCVVTDALGSTAQTGMVAVTIERT